MSEAHSPARLTAPLLAQAARTPDAPALIDRHTRSSYAELSTALRRCAAGFSACGLRGKRVAVCGRRSVRLVTAILAALDAGVIYVPIDANNPDARIRSILDASSIDAVLSDDPTRGAWGERPVLPLGQALEGELPRELQLAPSPPSEVAYIIHTSGSTGQPKGVQLHAAGVESLLGWAWSRYTPRELAWTLASTSLAFDLSIFELLAPLGLGGCVVLVDSMLELIDDQPPGPVTLINTVPSAARALLDAGRMPASVRTVNLAGEALYQDLVDDLYALPTIERVWNLYGPSEDTTYSTAWRTSPGAVEARVPIGRPLPGTSLFILDPRGQPVPAGVKGEIWLGGAGLSLGYVGRPELEAELFRRFDPGVGRALRLYRTGDLGLFDHQGVVHYRGRRDDQLKIRGHRVEVGDVEACLRAHPKVVGAAAGELEGELCAWIEVDEGLELGALREHVGARLPGAMNPTRWIVLDALPRSANGKLDRRALRACAQTGASRLNVSASEAGDPLVARLRALFGAVLERAEVGVDQDFFALGGHSLLAVELVVRARAQLGLELPLAQVFASPTPAGLAAFLARDSQVRGMRIEARPPTAPLRSSLAQQRQWALSQLGHERSPAQIPAVFDIYGPLDARALERALSAVVARHEVLRTVFEGREGGCVPRLLDAPASRLERPELAAAPSWDALIDRAVHEPIALERGPLRALLIERSPTHHVFVLVIHHIAADGWSLKVLGADLSRAYASARAGDPPKLASPSLQAADYTHWQQRRLAEGALAASEAWWRTQLRELPEPLSLPWARARRHARSLEGGTVRVYLSDATASALRSLARRSGATTFQIGLAAVFALLHRSSGATDICVGTPLGRRERPELAELVALVTSTVAVRMQLTADYGFGELLARLRSHWVELEAHAELPFERLLDTHGSSGVPGTSPVFQVLFSAEPRSFDTLELEGLRCETRALRRRVSKFDLTIVLREAPESVELVVEYASELFDADAIAQLCQRYEALLARACEAPDTRLAALPLLRAEEREHLLASIDGARSSAGGPQTIPAALGHWIAETPDARALAWQGGEMNYAQLAAHAQQLALRLRAAGVEAGARIGVSLPRSPELIVALVAICSLGACYVPLELELPRDELRRRALEAGIVHLLHAPGAALGELARSALRGISFELDERAPSASLEVASFDAETPVYVLYTSGSTGRPKGIVASHRAVLNLVREVDYVRLDPTRVVLHASASSFDASTFEIWGPLLNGGTLVLAPPGPPALDAIAQLVERHRVTTAFFTTSLFHLLVDTRPQLLCAIEELVFGGEVASAAQLRALRSAGHRGRLVNVYGPTECTTFSTTWCSLPDEPIPDPVPIGSPVPGAWVVVLDGRGRALPPGLEGELYIGGAGLARGYVDATLDADRFVELEIEGVSRRAYRSGDYGSHDGAGVFAFGGRRDRQVKINGVRVELEGLERLVGSHSQVRAAHAFGLEARAGSELVLCVESEGLSEAQLRAWLETQLAPHSRPSRVLVLARFPLKHNGKLDGAALRQRAVAEPELLGPRSATERRLQEIWSEVLGVASPELTRSFFELGGQSLLLIAVHERLRVDEQLPAAARSLDVLSLFEFTTIRALAAHIDGDPELARAEPQPEPAHTRAQQRRARRERRRKGRQA